MGIKINIQNTKITDDARAFNDMKINGLNDVNVEMDHVEIKDKAELLNNMTDIQIDEVLNRLEKQTELLEKTSEEYQEISNLLTEVQQNRPNVRKILGQHLPNLLTGTLANVLGNLLLK